MTEAREKAEEKIRQETNFYIREDGQLLWEDKGETDPVDLASDEGRLYLAALSREERLQKIAIMLRPQVEAMERQNELSCEIGIAVLKSFLSLAEGEK